MDKFKNLMICREGKNGSKMETLNILKIIKKNKNYKLVNTIFEETYKKETHAVKNIIKPPITVLNGNWDNYSIIKSTSTDKINQLINQNNLGDFNFELDFEIDNDSDDISTEARNTFSNILGNNVELLCFSNNYYIKPIAATSENVAYYGCKLLNQDDIFYFKSKQDMAIFKIVITYDYVNEYVMKLGGGVYLEHFDLHHIHIPLNNESSGYIILAKQKAENNYELSAFQIPFGKALIIPPNITHNDCFLVGNYNIIYGISEDYSTAILKYGNELVKFTFL
tara:strand:- start:4202 stop:5044 length:843 start_codon:yes stop_codon:yes gene_type:complete